MGSRTKRKKKQQAQEEELLGQVTAEPIPQEVFDEQTNAQDIFATLTPDEIHKLVITNNFEQTAIMREMLQAITLVAQQQAALIQFLMQPAE